MGDDSTSLAETLSNPDNDDNQMDVCPGMKTVLAELKLLQDTAQRPEWLSRVDVFSLDHGAVQVEFELEAQSGTVYDSESIKGKIHVHQTGRVDIVWLTGIIYHYLIDPRNHQMELPFAPVMDDDDMVDHGLENRVLNTIGHIRSALKSPLHPCDSCNEAYTHSAKIHSQRTHTILKYKPMRLHNELFGDELDDSWFEPHLLQALSKKRNSSDTTATLAKLLKQEGPGVYSFPIFTSTFCKMFLAELDHFQAKAKEHKLNVDRPNSMNNYGVIVNSIGLETLIDKIQSAILQPVAEMLYPQQGGQLDRHHSFMVAYTPGTDTHLDMHIDDSDVTFNVCLGKDFTASGLTFCGMIGKADHRKQTLQYPHIVGRCVVHLGTRRHGADVITAGERNNLIVWCHNDYYRASSAFQAHQKKENYETEASAPDLHCVSYTHDRDYGNFKSYPKALSHFKGQGWCPPKSAEYLNFITEQSTTETRDTYGF